MRTLAPMLPALVLLAMPALSLDVRQEPAALTEGPLAARARAIHDRVIALDTHVDINVRDFTATRNYTQRLETQVDLPKMIVGGLDAAFLIVYVQRAQCGVAMGFGDPRRPAAGLTFR